MINTGAHRAPRPGLGLLLLVGFASGCAVLPLHTGKTPLPFTIAGIVERELIEPLEQSGASVGMVVSDMEGVQLYAHDSNRLLVPASVQKLMVAADAKLHLPEGYRWHTELVATGKIDTAGVLLGNLLLRGTWDPTLADNHPYTGWPWEPFEEWVQELRVRGIGQINGTLIAQGRVFLPDGWEVSDLDASYAPAISELSWNDGLITSYAGRVMDHLFWEVWPDPLVWSEDHGRGRVWPQPPSPSGPTPNPPMDHDLWPGLERLEMRAAYDPRALTADAFRAALRQGGIDGLDSVAVVDTLLSLPGEYLFTLTHHSAPLNEILTSTMATSSNAWSEMVQATVSQHLGKDPLGKPHWPAVLDTLGVARRGLRATDGSGLSRKNNLTPATIQDLLLAGWERWGQEWVDLLPRANQPRTSLATRMVGHETRIAAKTGSMSRCSSLAGYILEDGIPVAAFTIIVNNAPFNPADRIDRTVMLLSERMQGEPTVGRK